MTNEKSRQQAVCNWQCIVASFFSAGSLLHVGCYFYSSE
jgi:hypothetical protein